MRISITAILLFLGLIQSTSADAQAARSIRLIVPFAAGGTSDVMARLIATPLGSTLGQPVIVENRPGATGAIATDQVSRAEPDGLTLLFTNVGPSAIAPATSKSSTYDPNRDVTAISLVARSPLLLVTNPGLNVKDLQGLVNLAKSAPGRIEYSSAGVGSFGHLSTELFAQAAGIRLLHVPYQGQAPAVNSVVSGEVKMSLTSPSSAMFELVRAGRLRMMGMSYLEASTLAPEVVPIANTLPNFEAQFWFGIVGPPKMSGAIVERLNDGIRKVLSDRALAQRIEGLGADVATSSPQEFQQLLSTEAVRWRKVVRATNLQTAD